MQLNQTTIQYNEQKIELPVGKMSFFEELYVDYKLEEGIGFQRLQLSIHPKENVVLHQIELQFHHEFEETDQVFCNGFQSWSESRMYSFREKPAQILALAKARFGVYGDRSFKAIPNEKGKLHSWTYSYFQQKGQTHFIGSLSEQAGFTIIQFDRIQKKISVRKDCSGLNLGHSFAILDLLIFKGAEEAAFEKYFALMENKVPTLKAYTAWTNGNAYSHNNSENYILKNLALLTKHKSKVDFIQIEDGYQVAIGDWLNTKASFPNGMKAIASKISTQGFRPAIWIAPFVCERKSDIFQHKKAWLLKDENGQIVKAAYHKTSKEPLYALDFYKEDFQKYLTGVFFTLLNKWGFELLKMDFLYAVCLLPRKHKTRGQIMCEAMQFLHNLIGKKLSFANAVPLGASFGQVDFCNVASNSILKWEQRLQKLLQNRERNTGLASLQSTLGRWQLNGKAFLNAASFSLDSSTSKLTTIQQSTILLVHSLLSNLLYNADDLSAYSVEQWAEFESMFKWKNSKVQTIQQLSPTSYLIYFEQETKNYIAACNLANEAASFQFKRIQFELEAYESLILSSVEIKKNNLV